MEITELLLHCTNVLCNEGNLWYRSFLSQGSKDNREDIIPIIPCNVAYFVTEFDTLNF